MIITAILTIFVIWCLFYMLIPKMILVFLCLILGGFFVIIGRHEHDGFLQIDILVQKSRLSKLSPSLKLFTVLILISLCISSRSVVPGLFLSILMLALIVFIGGLELHYYLSLLSLPLSFLLISGLALLFEYHTSSVGVINIPFIHGYLAVSKASQNQAALIMAKAIGSLSCMYFLSLTTSMSEIIGVLRRCHVHDIIIELMYLIYRYIFLLFEMVHLMKTAAGSRLGYRGFRRSLRTTGYIYTNLLARSYQKANKNFDAMESRCYTGEIRFLGNKKSLQLRYVAVSMCIILFTFGLVVGFQ